MPRCSSRISKSKATRSPLRPGAREAVRLGQELTPDLVVLDIRLPDIDGYEVCRRLRSHRRTAHIPIIFLTEKRDRVDKLAGLQLGVVDYITKPFDIQELRLRVRNALQRADTASQFNPITELPEGDLVDERLAHMLKTDDWAVLVVSVDGLEAFRADFGFKAADDVLRAVSKIARDSASDASAGDRFVGHLTPGALLVVTTLAHVDAVAAHIEALACETGADLYPLSDQEKALRAMRDNRLHVTVNRVTSQDGDFAGLDDLKDRLARAG
ncbi:MAG: response regulator [Anaerolineae bacterium]|nr:response regulator [Anaerolineae bacterium]